MILGVEDSKLCFATGQTTVEEPSAIDITPLGFDSVICNGFSDGTAFVGGVTGVTGGNGSVYSYTWTDALGVDLLQDNDTAVGLSAGYMILGLKIVSYVCHRSNNCGGAIQFIFN